MGRGGQWPGENRTNKFEARKRIHLPRFSPLLGRARRAADAKTRRRILGGVRHVIAYAESVGWT